MNDKSQNLIWIDLEMTGLEVETCRIIEIATVVTDSELNILEEGPNLAIHQSDAQLDAMDDWNQVHHGRSGLIERVKASLIDDAEAEQKTLSFLKKWVPAGISPMCGNSVCTDRRFLHRYMPALEQYFHYRSIDVSTVKELAQRWAPSVFQGFSKHSNHMALEDILASIKELAYYRQHFVIM